MRCLRLNGLRTIPWDMQYFIWKQTLTHYNVCSMQEHTQTGRVCFVIHSLCWIIWRDTPWNGGGYNLEFAQLLVKYGAHTYGTCAAAFVKQQRASDYAIVWCFANVLPPGARDIAEEFLKRYDELSWTKK
jgi:hypothetical protein